MSAILWKLYLLASWQQHGEHLLEHVCLCLLMVLLLQVSAVQWLKLTMTKLSINIWTSPFA